MEKSNNETIVGLLNELGLDMTRGDHVDRAADLLGFHARTIRRWNTESSSRSVAPNCAVKLARYLVEKNKVFYLVIAGDIVTPEPCGCLFHGFDTIEEAIKIAGEVPEKNKLKIIECRGSMSFERKLF